MDPTLAGDPYGRGQPARVSPHKKKPTCKIMQVLKPQKPLKTYQNHKKKPTTHKLPRLKPAGSRLRSSSPGRRSSPVKDRLQKEGSTLMILKKVITLGFDRLLVRFVSEFLSSIQATSGAFACGF